MLFLVPLIVIALYVGMYLMRSNKTGACRWRQVGKNETGVRWRCPVCGAEAETVAGEPKFCGGQGPR
ncbi:hypothetical protein [Celeribacter ethanolicus]|uniref:hypothetical protein n=1 Tax=Celeribacter ethanolicus TaxID=1758178 RepID=UPI00082F3EDB|nr:hypothetical protein [Celeribacter ethanolicus]